MTVTHLLFAVVTTAYILVAIQLEERDLISAHPEYAEYRRRVPMLVPAWPQQVPASGPARPPGVRVVKCPCSPALRQARRQRATLSFSQRQEVL